MAMNAGMYTSNTDLWATPQEFFNEYDALYHFETDVCAISENAKCAHYFTPEQDGLKQEWTGVCWMNPPYGREIGKWVRKAYESARDNLATVVCLLPARTDTKWFHDYVLPHADVRFIKGRIKFGGGSSAPFPSIVAVFPKGAKCECENERSPNGEETRSAADHAGKRQGIA